MKSCMPSANRKIIKKNAPEATLTAGFTVFADTNRKEGTNLLMIHVIYEKLTETSYKIARLFPIRVLCEAPTTRHKNGKK